MAPDKQGSISVQITVAVILAIGGIIAAFVQHSEKTAPKKPDLSISFVGRVLSDTQTPIPGAQVLITADEAPGQSTRTDANGQFQVQLPSETKSLRLAINADGFASETVQANFHRTGPEEIYLHPLPKQPAIPFHFPTALPNRISRNHSTTPENVEPKTADAPGTQQPPPPQPGIVNNGINNGVQNNCSPGVINCDQSLHLHEAPPPPHAGFSQHYVSGDSDGIASQGTGSRTYPEKSRVEITVGIDTTSTNPVFELTCDVRCEPVGPVMLGKREGSSMRATSVDADQGYAAGELVWHVAVNTTVSSEAVVIFQFQSLSRGPMQVTSLKAVTK